jgi:hypothetical protein
MKQTTQPRPRLTLQERVSELNMKQRDCRSCKAFVANEEGLGYGWCTAFDKYVKLYHGQFWSQCQFKIISRASA